MRTGGMVFVASCADTVIGYAFWIVAARQLTPEVVGTIALVIALTAGACRLSTAGAGLAMIELVRRPGADRFAAVANGLCAAGLLALCAGIVVVLVAPLASPRFALLQTLPAAVAFVAAAAVWTIHLLIDDTLVGLGLAGWVAVRAVVFSAAKLFLLLLVTLMGMRSAWPVVVGWYGCAAVVAVWTLMAVKRRLDATCRRSSISPARMVVFVKSLAAHHISIIGGSIAWTITPVLVAASVDPSDFAFFSIAWTIGSAIQLIHSAGALSLFTHTSAATTQGIGHATRRAFAAVLGLVIMVLTVILVAGKQIVLLFGEQYSARSHPILVQLAFAALPAVGTQLGAAVWRAQRRLRRLTIFNTCMASALAVGTWLLLPSLGYFAPGTTLLVTRFAGLTVLAVFLWVDRRSQAKATAFTGHPDARPLPQPPRLT